MPQTRLTFFNHGDPEHIADPWVQDQATLGRLALAQREAARADAEARATLADRRYAQQRDMRDFAERQREFQARLGDAAQQRMEERAQADRLFEASQAQRAWQQQAEQRQEARLGEAMRLSNEDRDLARQDALAARAAAAGRHVTDALSRTAEQKAQWNREDQRYARTREDQLAAEQRAVDREATLYGRRRADQLDDREFEAGLFDRRQKQAIDLQEDRQAQTEKVAAQKAAELTRGEGIEAASRRKYGVDSAAARFMTEAMKIRDSKTATSEDAKLAALIQAAEAALRPNPDLVDEDPTTGRKLPVWRPTNQEEYQVLQAALMEAARRVFPEAKTYEPRLQEIRSRVQAVQDRLPGGSGATALVAPGFLPGALISALPDAFKSDTFGDFAAETYRWAIPEALWRARGYPQRTDYGLGAEAVASAYTRNAGLFRPASGR